MSTDAFKVLVSEVLVGVLSGAMLHLSIDLIRSAYKFTKKLIRITQVRQKLGEAEVLGSYADLEELLGDFLEKYRNLSRQTPAPTRWGFYFEMALDILGLARGVVEMSIRRLVGFDKAPRA